MENLVGRKVKCLESYDGVTKGKEYTITNVDNSGFYIIEDDGRKQNWCISHLYSRAHLKLLIEEPQFKQGDKVLVSNNEKDWVCRKFIIEHKNKFLCEVSNDNESLGHWGYIKPYEDEIKIGDWVKRVNDKIIWLIENKEDIDLAKRTDCEIITNIELIKLLNEEL